MSLNVLAIDDSRTMRTMLDIALKDCGFQVCLAEDGQQGLDTLKNFTPDVIVTDLNMPVMDGFGVIEGVRKHSQFSATPVLVLTTESAQELKQRARKPSKLHSSKNVKTCSANSRAVLLRLKTAKVTPIQLMPFLEPFTQLRGERVLLT